MKPTPEPSDWRPALILGGLGLVTLVSFGLSFTHMHDWTMAHMPTGTSTWAGWGNAVISELIPIISWLAIGANQKKRKSVFYPLCLFIGGVLLSLAAQIGAAGPEADLSRKFLMTLPAIAALALSKFLLASPGDAEAAVPPPPPNLVPPPPMVLPESPLANAPLSAPPAPRAREQLSPGTAPPVVHPPAPPDSASEDRAAALRERVDNAQLTDTFPPSAPSTAGGGAAAEVLPEDTLAGADRSALEGERAPQDTPEADTVREGDPSARDGGTSGLDPIDLETWEHHQKGLSKKQLATKYGCHEKTIQRRLSKVRAVIDTTATEEEPTNAQDPDHDGEGEQVGERSAQGQSGGAAAGVRA